MPKETWFRPYENFSLSDVSRNIRFFSHLEALSSDIIEKPEGVGQQYIPYYDKDGLWIIYDRTLLDESDMTKTSNGARVYYPIRPPNPEEIVRKGHVVANGFGNLLCMYSLNNEETITIHGIELYPYALFLQAPSGTYYSIGSVVVADEEDSIDASYVRWKPYRSAQDAGYSSVPTNLPSLQKLEFKLSRLDPDFVCKQIPFFQA